MSKLYFEFWHIERNIFSLILWFCLTILSKRVEKIILVNKQEYILYSRFVYVKITHLFDLYKAKILYSVVKFMQFVVFENTFVKSDKILQYSVTFFANIYTIIPNLFCLY